MERRQVIGNRFSGIDACLQSIEIWLGMGFLSNGAEPEFFNLGTNSARLCSLAGQNNNPIPTRFLAPIDCLKIPAQFEQRWHRRRRVQSQFGSNSFRDCSNNGWSLKPWGLIVVQFLAWKFVNLRFYDGLNMSSSIFVSITKYKIVWMNWNSSRLFN